MIDPALSAAKELTPSQANAPKSIQYAIEQRAATIRRHYAPTLQGNDEYAQAVLLLCGAVENLLSDAQYWRQLPTYQKYYDLQMIAKDVKQASLHRA